MTNSAVPGVEYEVLIQPSRGWVSVNLREVWAYRELLYFLAWRDIKVRYKQTVIGAAWAIVQPFFTMVVFSLFFGHLGRMPSDGIPYPVFVYCALLPWQLFAHVLTESSNSVVGSQQLITKVYFPRLIAPIAAVCGGLVDFAIAFFVLLGMMVFYGLAPGAAVGALPLFILLAVLTALGVGLWLSVLNVRYRDVRYALGFLTQLWLFATPVAYSSSLIPEKWRVLYGANPMVGVVEGFRWVMLGKAAPPAMLLVVSAAVVLLVLVGGLHYFARMEETFADVV